jgi:hypothetical protein
VLVRNNVDESPALANELGVEVTPKFVKLATGPWMALKITTMRVLAGT